MVPHLKFEFTSFKLFENKSAYVHKTCVYNSSNFQNQTRNTLGEIKKDKLNMNSATKSHPQNDAIHIAISFLFFFCFSQCISNLVLRILENVNTHLVDTHKFLPEFFGAYKYEFCKMVSYRCHQIFPRNSGSLIPATCAYAYQKQQADTPLQVGPEPPPPHAPQAG
jgi:hypothetical protein